MPALRELQELFRESLFGEPAPALVDLVEGDGLDPAAGLAVYHHHVFTTLTAALESVFPVVRRLVDPRFFAYAADAFIRAHPPAGPCLDEYGEAFPGFLADFEACRPLPWLPDVARLEWAIHRASQAPAGEPLDSAGLGGVPPSDMARLRFVATPGLAHLSSPWPVDRIWLAHQEEGQALPDLGAGSVWLEIGPSAAGVLIRSLDPASFSFRMALTEGRTLGEAAEAVQDVDLESEIRGFLGDNVFSNFAIATEDGA